MTHWDKLKAAERMQKYIEAHLGDRITMATLARVASYSQWHAARVFREVTGKSPFEYVRLRRLSVAAEELQNTSRKVVDVAFDFVFDSHEGFTRAFARQFGVSPLRFRKIGSTVQLFMPPQLRDQYTRRQRGELTMSENKKPDTVFVQILDRPARKMIIKRAKKATHYFEYCEEVGCDVWDQLTAIPNAIQEPLGMWLPDSLRSPGTSEYVQGVEVTLDFDGEVPEGFEVTTLPACKMMVFQGPPFEDKDFEQAISSLWDVMASYKPETYGFTWADDAGPRFQLKPEGYRGYIEGRPVRAV
ncbi:MAG: transcriptional regulator [Deltaproteobacteria bacterium RIFOXYA12_FULL_61_11]|nr:MAG: transcriptional regulator [Deltaproteobacteria bacterium RIFOXYA12_FULL_61_11]